MRIIQSCWARKADSLLSCKAGWLSPEYHLMGWALSALQLSQYYDSLTLYTDSTSARILIDELKLPYTEVICELDELNQYHQGLWALPKIHAYHREEAPFLHVDGDVFIWKEFDPALMGQGLIAQNKEIATAFANSIMTCIEETMHYFPEEVLTMRKQEEGIYSYNAGILGGTDIAFFREYSGKALHFIEQNLSYLTEDNVYHFNVVFEQYLFYCLSQRQQKPVALLLEGLYQDYGYQGMADFADVPHSRQFLHLLGAFKRDVSICTQMASRLRNDYPSVYYQIIQLFRDRQIPMKRDYYCFLPDIPAWGLLQRYDRLRSNGITSRDDASIRRDISDGIPDKKSFHNFRTKYVDFFVQYLDKSGFEPEIIDCMRAETEAFEQRILHLLQGRFLALDNEVLYARDLRVVSELETLFGDKHGYRNQWLVADRLFARDRTRFDWTQLDNTKGPSRFIFKKVLASDGAENYLAIIPECHQEGYSLLNLSSLDMLILDLLDQPVPVHELQRQLVNAFGEDDLGGDLASFHGLLEDRIKALMVNKLVHISDSHAG